MKASVFVLSITLLLAAGFAADKTRIAILSLEAKPGVDAGTVSTIGDLLAGELVSLRRFDVVDRKNMQAILKEQALQNSGCTESACAVKLGNILNVQKMVVGNVAKLGSKLIISVSFVDVERSKVDLSERATADNEDDILPKVAAMAKRIGAQTPLAGRLVTVQDAKTALANVGRDDGLRVGQTVRILRYGDAIIDSATGDFLGRKVEEVGDARVVSLDPGGQLSTLKVGKETGEIRKEDRVLVSAGEISAPPGTTGMGDSQSAKASPAKTLLLVSGIVLTLGGGGGGYATYTVSENFYAAYKKLGATNTVKEFSEAYKAYTDMQGLTTPLLIAGGVGVALIVTSLFIKNPDKNTAVLPTFNGRDFGLAMVHRF